MKFTILLIILCDNLFRWHLVKGINCIGALRTPPPKARGHGGCAQTPTPLRLLRRWGRGAAENPERGAQRAAACADSLLLTSSTWTLSLTKTHSGLRGSRAEVGVRCGARRRRCAVQTGRCERSGTGQRCSPDKSLSEREPSAAHASTMRTGRHISTSSVSPAAAASYWGEHLIWEHLNKWFTRVLALL